MYDAIIVGCGPAGMTAGIYLARAGKKVAIIEKETIGGQMSTSPLIENYPGFSKISGSDLSNNMYEQLISSGAEVIIGEVTNITTTDVVTEDENYHAKVIILATGAKYRKLNIPREEDFIGRGIHFCTSCDGMFYKNRTVAVIGGANSAVINALYLSDICSKVYLIYRKDKLRAENILINRLNEKKNIEILYNTNVTSILGENNFEGIKVKNPNKEYNLDLDGMFESIGMEPETGIAADLLELSDDKYFKHNNTCSKYENIFVIGDCNEKDVKQIATAVSDGATAATLAIHYLNK